MTVIDWMVLGCFAVLLVGQLVFFFASLSISRETAGRIVHNHTVAFHMNPAMSQEEVDRQVKEEWRLFKETWEGKDESD